jgi:hypothetical protein
MKRKKSAQGLMGLGMGVAFLLGQVLAAQQTPASPAAKPKPKTAAAAAKPGVAVWTPDVQKVLGVTAENFNAEGLNKLTKAQLNALLISARPDPGKRLLSCAATTLAPGSRIHVLLTVAGDDSSGQIAGQIRQAIGSITGVDVVDKPAGADRALHVVIQEQTMGKRTIGFTASYLTSTPCTEDVNGTRTDVELKGTLGTYTDPKGADLARDLAGMLDQDLQPARGATK